MSTKTQAISLDRIITDGGTQMRVSLQESAVAEYCGLLADSKQWPFDSPLTVFHDGTDYYLADGFHRYMAAKRAQRSSAPCSVIAGSVRDAIKFALSANARHGLRRTNEDKRKAVQTALADNEWSKLSSRSIAEVCGVSPGFVDHLRAAGEKPLLPTVGSSGKGNAANNGKSETRVARDGSVRSATAATKNVEKPAVEDDRDGVPKKPANRLPADKQEPTKKETISHLKSQIKQHNAAMMRMVDELQGLAPNKQSHEMIHRCFRQTHESIEAWK